MIYFNIVINLIQMISRILTRTITQTLRRTPQLYGLMTVPSYSFSRNLTKSSNFAQVLQD